MRRLIATLVCVLGLVLAPAAAANHDPGDGGGQCAKLGGCWLCPGIGWIC